MSRIPNDQMLNRIMTEFGYPRKRAESAVRKLHKLQPEIKTDFENWWLTGEIPGSEIEGYTVSRLQGEYSMNPIAAFLTLDWLIRDPEIARTTLERGFDRVVIGGKARD